MHGDFPLSVDFFSQINSNTRKVLTKFITYY